MEFMTIMIYQISAHTVRARWHAFLCDTVVNPAPSPSWHVFLLFIDYCAKNASEPWQGVASCLRGGASDAVMMSKKG